ncbi:MAG: 3-deoxy-manno-octulosonate cytidylyltransferase [Deltaproteobacteria bacterium]|jgi:3-deoxy-manno-octulosonate cytidylyltransferase (CMP-KDO synthetase)|nr:3-deoxy-manno-octulosonate cytidylyltransferase [Deltaproteobacteria bacterium]
MTSIFALIPARFESTRFPGKPLALILGEPMISHVYKRASLIKDIDGVYVATDSPEIYDKVLEFGGKVIMTKKSHPSGSDRLAEAAHILGIEGDDIVLNIQGDQPALNPEHPRLLYRALLRSATSVTATLAIPMEMEDVFNPNHVKVVLDQSSNAIYFSRSPIPHGGKDKDYLKHIGIYAFRASFLYKYVSLPRGPLELAESLEQLRILENGYQIKVVVSDGLSPEVDTPQDIALAEAAISNG